LNHEDTKARRKELNTYQPSWTSIAILNERFAANLNSLAGRHLQLAEKLRTFSPTQAYFLLPSGDQIQLGVGSANSVQALAHPVSPVTARSITSQLYPNGKCSHGVAIGGEDLGWLWNCVYQLPCEVPIAPGHRPPLFFLIRDIERFWVILHIQDWKTLLADARVQLFAGEDAFEQFQIALAESTACPWPRMSITIDPAVWPAGLSLDQMLASAKAATSEKMAKVNQQLRLIYSGITPHSLAAKYQSDRPLRVLGITSRYTTFLQYSMRDWLAAFEGLGHQARLVIETNDHEIPSGLSLASTIADFKPDLIVMIDHYRGEHGGLVPEIPFVMWVQDRLPNIYSANAGEAQKRLDYTIGYSRGELTQRFGYPASRFMPTMMAVNQARFTPKPLSDAELNRYRCDVSFVSNCTAPAEQIIREEMDRQNPVSRALLDDIFQQFKGIYDAGESVTTAHAMRAILVDSIAKHKASVDIEILLQLFIQRVNNSLFRHQAIRWVAEMGVDLHLYGKGWEAHPEFSRYAKGVADNLEQLPAIYRASSINLQVTPYGAVHQRLLDGLAAGGFFLLRSVTPDELELLHRDIWNWCLERKIRSGRDMAAQSDGALLKITRRFAEIGSVDPMSDPDYFYSAAEECALAGFTRTPNTLWENGDRVTFSKKDQLQSQVRYFLANPDERRQIAQSMRQRVLETHTYQNIARRMLKFMANDLQEFSGLEKRAA
jgi:hypothetical protein